MIDRASWQRASATLDEGLAIAPSERAQWLSALAERDAALASLVRRLLARAEPEAVDGDSNADTGERVTASATRFDALLVQALDEQGSAPATAWAGRRLGAWALESQIGEGGMGQVWLARRADGLYQARAAIKLLRSDLARDRLAARFARERAVLARLNHPGIAKLLDAGIADGQAYLVLEHVDGRLLGEHVAAACPTVADRVALLLRIAQAVDHAHAQLIVHRDLKPGNVMVTADGAPKLLDFGIAGLLDDDEGAGQLTRFTGRGLTLGYAAPEQITGATIGVAADVFSLGVMLFELLAGVLPFGAAQDSRTALEHAVLHEPPPRLAALAGAPPQRPVDAQRARGDLEAVVNKALRKLPAERYGSVRALIDDLQAWLDHRPVSVRRDDWRHRGRLWLRRNALAAALAGAVLLALSAGLGASLWQWQRAERAAQQSDQLTDYLGDLLAGASPDEHGGNWPNVLQLLDKSRAEIDTRFEREPGTKARLLAVLARTYYELNRSDVAIPLAERALALSVAEFGPDDKRSVGARLLLGRQYVAHGPWDKVAALLEPIRAQVPRHFGRLSDENRSLLYSLSHAQSRLGRLAEAEATLVEGGQVTEGMFAPGHMERTAHNNQLSILYSDQGRIRESLDELLKTEAFQRNPPPGQKRMALVLRRNTLAMQNRLALNVDNEARAAQLFIELDQLLGLRNTFSASLHAEMARWHLERGDWAKALREREAVISGSAPDSASFRAGQVPERTLRLVARVLARAAPPEALRAEARALAAELQAAQAQIGSVRLDAGLALARAALLLDDPPLAAATVQRLRADATLASALADATAQGGRLNQTEGQLARAQGDLARSRALLPRRIAQAQRGPDQVLVPTWSAQLDLACTLVLLQDPGAAAALDQAERWRPPTLPAGHPLDAAAAWLRALLAAGGRDDAAAVQTARQALEAAYGRTLEHPLPQRLGGVF